MSFLYEGFIFSLFVYKTSYNKNKTPGFSILLNFKHNNIFPDFVILVKLPECIAFSGCSSLSTGAVRESSPNSPAGGQRDVHGFCVSQGWLGCATLKSDPRSLGSSQHKGLFLAQIMCPLQFGQDSAHIISPGSRLPGELPSWTLGSGKQKSPCCFNREDLIQKSVLISARRLTGWREQRVLQEQRPFLSMGEKRGTVGVIRA